MRRILIGYVLDGKTGGIDRYLLNILDILQENGVKVDFLTPKIDAWLKEELQKRGSELYEIASLKHFLKQYHQTRQIIHAGGYDAAYFNISEAFNCMGILAAAKEGIPQIMVHSHSSGNSDSEWWKRMLKRGCHEIAKHVVMGGKPTDYIACSKKAGEWMFPEKIVRSDSFRVLNNAVQADQFYYNERLRVEKRQELEVEDRIIIGHVGSFCYAKNIGFLLDIIDELRKKIPKVLLLSVGSGVEFEAMQKKVDKLNLHNYVKFLGNRNDVSELLQAMDLFLLPSRFEGLPIVAIEAQVAGLKVILSDTISGETALSDKCIFFDLRRSAGEWAQVVLENLDYKREVTDFSGSDYVFNVRDQETQIKNIFGIDNG